MNISKNMADIAFKALDEKLAIDINVIDIAEVSSIADYFIIASGNNVNQVQAIADNVMERMAKAGYDTKQVEGYQSARWILIDYKDIVVHVFLQEDREFYNIERVWRDGNFLDMEDLKKKLQ